MRCATIWARRASTAPRALGASRPRPRLREDALRVRDRASRAPRIAAAISAALSRPASRISVGFAQRFMHLVHVTRPAPSDDLRNMG